MSVVTLPLFPLHTVLVPGFPLALHIFEERYRKMIGECVSMDRPFGVSLIREGEEVGAPALPFDIGTVATLAEVERLADGGYNILVVGSRRFRLDELLPPDPYPCARVSLLDEEDADQPEPELSAELKALAEEYIRRLTATEASVQILDVPEDAPRLSWLLTYLLQIPVREKQSLLEDPSALKRLDHAHALLARELSVMQATADATGQPYVRPLDTDRLRSRTSSN